MIEIGLFREEPSSCSVADLAMSGQLAMLVEAASAVHVEEIEGQHGLVRVRPT